MATTSELKQIETALNKVLLEFGKMGQGPLSPDLLSEALTDPYTVAFDQLAKNNTILSGMSGTKAEILSSRVQVSGLRNFLDSVQDALNILKTFSMPVIDIKKLFIPDEVGNNKVFLKLQSV